MHARVPRVPAPQGRPAVVLVHGLVVSSRYMVPTLARLAPHYRVYAPDLPGFGRSEKPPRALDIPGLSDSLAAWMEAMGLDRASFVGNSVGCQVIVELALRHPGLVEKVVLHGPTVDPRGRSFPRQAARLLLDYAVESPSLWLVALQDLVSAGVRLPVDTFRHALRDRPEEKLPRVRAQALVVRGSRDQISPRHWAEEVAQLLPRGRLVVIPGAPHAANCSTPAEFVRELRPFLDGG